MSGSLKTIDVYDGRATEDPAADVMEVLPPDGIVVPCSVGPDGESLLSIDRWV